MGVITVGDILELCSEHALIEVVDFEDGEILASYNGRDSIPSSLNGIPVTQLDTGFNSDTGELRPTLKIGIALGF